MAASRQARPCSGLGPNPPDEPLDNNDWLTAYWTLAAAQAQMGRTEEARSTIDCLLAKTPGMRLADVARVTRNPGRDVLLLEGLRKAGLSE